MSDDFYDYPNARISMGAGDLIDVTEVSLRIQDGETVVSTMRQNPAGSHSGKKSAEVSFKSAVSEAGFERDFKGKHRKRERVQLRIKVPGTNWSVTGRFTNPEISSNVDGMIEFSISLIGKLS